MQALIFDVQAFIIDPIILQLYYEFESLSTKWKLKSYPQRRKSRMPVSELKKVST